MSDGCFAASTARIQTATPRTWSPTRRSASSTVRSCSGCCSGSAFPFGLGVTLTGSVVGGLTGLLWRGAVRILFLHHATFSINSLCHFLGRRRFRTGDESRNLAWLALPTFGEAWHNNHHAFQTSAHLSLASWQLDPSGWLINALERLGLAWDVVRIAPSAQEAKLLS